jgi:hypothetical protein
MGSNPILSATLRPLGHLDGDVYVGSTGGKVFVDRLRLPDYGRPALASSAS